MDVRHQSYTYEFLEEKSGLLVQKNLADGGFTKEVNCLSTFEARGDFASSISRDSRDLLKQEI